MATSSVSETIAHLTRLTSNHPNVLSLDRFGKTAVRVGHEVDLEQGPDKRLKVVRYFTTARKRMTEMVQQSFVSPLPLLAGHVELNTGPDNQKGEPPDLSALIYVGNVDIRAAVKFHHNPDEPYEPAAVSCYRAAHLVGLGDNWTESLIDMVNTGQQLFDFETTYDDAQVTRLNLTLEDY